MLVGGGTAAADSERDFGPWLRAARATTLESMTTPARQTSSIDRHRDPAIVVGVDGSPSSRAALRRAYRLASAQSLRLEVVAAWSWPRAYGDYPIAGSWTPDVDTSNMLRAMLLDEFRGSTPDWIHGDVVEGRTASVLVERSRTASMLVVGSRGHGGFAGLLLGSVSSACAEHARCPVLVVHGGEAAITDGELSRRRIELV